MEIDPVADLLTRIAASLKPEDLEDPEVERLLRLAMDIVDPQPDELPPELVVRLMGIDDKAKRFHEAIVALGVPPTPEAMSELARSMQAAGLLSTPEQIAKSEIAKAEGGRRVLLEHYSDHKDLGELDPKKFGTGHWGKEHRRAPTVPRTYYYIAGHGPHEDQVKQGVKTKYVGELPKGHRIYDIGADPDKILDRHALPSGFAEMDGVEQEIKDSGYAGYHNSKHPTLPHVVAYFHKLKVRPADAPLEKAHKFKKDPDAYFSGDRHFPIGNVWLRREDKNTIYPDTVKEYSKKKVLPALGGRTTSTPPEKMDTSYWRKLAPEHPHDPAHPTVMIDDGHHRATAAHASGTKWIRVTPSGVHQEAGFREPGGLKHNPDFPPKKLAKGTAPDDKAHQNEDAQEHDKLREGQAVNTQVGHSLKIGDERAEREKAIAQEKAVAVAGVRKGDLLKGEGDSIPLPKGYSIKVHTEANDRAKTYRDHDLDVDDGGKFHSVTLHHEKHGAVGHVNGVNQEGKLYLGSAELNGGHRGKGLGSAMYEHLYREAAKHGASEVVSTGPSMQAKAVHERMADRHGTPNKSKTQYTTRYDNPYFKKSGDLEKGQNGDWRKEGYTLHHETLPSGNVRVKAKTKEGEHAGLFEFGPAREHETHIVPLTSTVHPLHRRVGLATAAYELAEKVSGKKLKPSGVQTEDASALWGQRDRKFGKSEALRKVSEKYKELMRNGVAVLHPATIDGMHTTPEGVPIHATVKVFHPENDSDEEIHRRMLALDHTPPDPAKTTIKPVVLTDRNGDPVHALELGGDAERLGQSHKAFEGMGYPAKWTFRPHLSLDQGTWQRIIDSGAKTAAEAKINFGRPELKHGFTTIKKY